MAQFFFFSNRPTRYSPSFSSVWTGTATATRYNLSLQSQTGRDLVQTGPTISFANSNAGSKQLDRQYISPPLSESHQTIQGTWSGKLQVREYNPNDNVNRLVVGLFLSSYDCSTIKATLIPVSNYGTTNEFPNSVSLASRIMGSGGHSIASVDGQSGDRLILEIGYGLSADGTTAQASANWGDMGRKIAENQDETATAPSIGWFSFNDVNLKFRVNPTTVTVS